MQHTHLQQEQRTASSGHGGVSGHGQAFRLPKGFSRRVKGLPYLGICQFRIGHRPEGL